VRVRLIQKRNLTDTQARHLKERLFAPEHELDAAPRNTWDVPEFLDRFYCVLLADSLLPIGVLYADCSSHEIITVWWIDSCYRRQAYASEAVRLLADILRPRGPFNLDHLLSSLPPTAREMLLPSNLQS
jgi:RimJ/RimL family protein N-acetyltransferase